MATVLGKIVADFTTSLAASVSIGGTSATLQSATDDDGVSLPAGTYYFAIDGNNSNKEYIKCTLSGTSLSSISTVTRQGSVSSGFARAHRVGASVTLTDFAQLKLLTDLLTGGTDLDSSDPLKYDGTATISDNAHLATKAYVDGVAVAGASNANETTKGIIELATQAETEAGTSTGATGARLVVPNDANGARYFAGYAADAGANDTYVITLSPVPTAYTTGMIIAFKANTANTGACTINVNALGAKTIKKDVSSDLATNDILAGQFVLLIYDGNNFQLLSADFATVPYVTATVAAASKIDIQKFTSNGTWTKPSVATTVDVYLIGGGGGGGSGRKGVTAGAGGGGGGGGFVKKTFTAAALAGTEAVVVGTGGAGGTAQSGADTNGNTGTSGNASTFGTNLLRAAGGSGGTGGTGTTAAGGAGGDGNGDVVFTGGSGGQGGATTGTDATVSTTAPSPRGGGGGAQNGSLSGAGGGFTTNYVKAGGAAVTSAAGTAATSTDDDLIIGGVGGSGGSGAGNAGGAGAFPGGGGGGGGCTSGGGNSGAGGVGGDGFVIVITHI